MSLTNFYWVCGSNVCACPLPEIEMSFSNGLAQAAVEFAIDSSKEQEDKIWLEDLERNSWDVNLVYVLILFLYELMQGCFSVSCLSHL